MRSVLGVFVGIATLLATVWPAAGADLGPESMPGVPTSQWRLSFTPYGWATWIKGDQTVKGRTVGLDVDPVQMVEHLDALPFMGYAEARNGPFAFYGDIVYAKLGLDADRVTSRGAHPAISGSLSASLGQEFEQTVAELGGVYQIGKWTAPSGGLMAVDVLAGARYWHQDMSINLALTNTLDIGDLVVTRGIAVARGGGVDWVDPVVGARLRHHFAPGQELVLRGDIGGFGLGSDLTWNVAATYSFVICTQDGVTYSGLVGYRALDVDYEQGSGRTQYRYDVLQHGPLSGLTISF